MQKKVRLYIKPFVTALIFFLLGLTMFVAGLNLAESMHESNYYALVAFGFIFLLVAIIVFIVYGGLERKFQKVMNNQTLLNYTITDNQFNDTANKNADYIKINNKILLIIMLFFCVIFAILGPIVIEDDGIIISYICIGLGVFLTIISLIITRYRVNKLKKGSRLVVLSKSGAYVCGEFHCWDIPSTKLTNVAYTPPLSKDKNGFIKIDYQALTLPGPTYYSVEVPIQEGMDEMAKGIVNILMG